MLDMGLWTPSLHNSLYILSIMILNPCQIWLDKSWHLTRMQPSRSWPPAIMWPGMAALPNRPALCHTMTGFWSDALLGILRTIQRLSKWVRAERWLCWIHRIITDHWLRRYHVMLPVFLGVPELSLGPVHSGGLAVQLCGLLPGISHLLRFL